MARAPSSGGHLRREGTFAGRKLSPAWAVSPGGHFRREGVGDERRGKDGRREGARRAETHVRRAETSARRERLERTHSSALRGEASARGEQPGRGATRPWGARQEGRRGCSTSGDACASRKETHVRRAKTSARRERLWREHTQVRCAERLVRAASSQGAARRDRGACGARGKDGRRGCSTSGDACASRGGGRALREKGENALV